MGIERTMRDAGTEEKGEDEAFRGGWRKAGKTCIRGWDSRRRQAEGGEKRDTSGKRTERP